MMKLRLKTSLFAASSLAGALTFLSAVQANEQKPHAFNAFEAVNGESYEDYAERWDAVFDTPKYVYGKEPADFLKQNIQMISVGKVLDLAMGEGRNSVYLAKKGFDVEGVDISEVALRKANRLAKDNRVSIKTIRAGLASYNIKPESYDVIVNINFLMRSLVPQIKRGLRQGGIIVFENWTEEQKNNSGGRSLGKDLMLSRGELREMFKDFEILLYRESNEGQNATASLIARKRLAER